MLVCARKVSRLPDDRCNASSGELRRDGIPFAHLTGVFNEIAGGVEDESVSALEDL
jgi:hypothetical protein